MTIIVSLCVIRKTILSLNAHVPIKSNFYHCKQLTSYLKTLLVYCSDGLWTSLVCSINIRLCDSDQLMHRHLWVIKMFFAICLVGQTILVISIKERKVSRTIYKSCWLSMTGVILHVNTTLTHVCQVPNFHLFQPRYSFFSWATCTAFSLF